MVRYTAVTGDTGFERGTAVEILVETARLWRSLGHHDPHGVFHIDGVTGPDEYSAVVDDNTYTNLMARSNLLAAADVCARHPEEAARLGVGEEETAAWRDAAESVHIPYN
ncbi:glycosyltransferase, partial [Streptomyces sp. NRRL F-6602]